MLCALEQLARVPADGDNVAIATRRLEPGTRIALGDKVVVLPHTVLEGHRFAIATIGPGEPLLSWGLPFGVAESSIRAGDYICNQRILTALSQRHVDFPLPPTPNFTDQLAPYSFDEAQFRPGNQVPPAPEARFFHGFDRGPRRGVGTRNYVVIVGASSRTASYARALATRFKGVTAQFPGLDGVVAAAHTEGGGALPPNNLEVVLRTLAGFVVHPNVGAVLVADLGSEPVTNALLRDYLLTHDYPLAEVPHAFLTLTGDFETALTAGEAVVKSWLPLANAATRRPQPLSALRIGLQCGGSDAFSGISANPLVGRISKELVRYGGSANLAETDELIGAEKYVLANVRDRETARAFLAKINQFQERVAWHGHTAESNPSGGNNFRGLYNIAIKSIGAARKKDPELRLDYVIDYAQPMTEPGFYFMDSPGNDLESIAGQVGSGCNLILFTTGNGSITNFPFVPTIKIVTTTSRFHLVQKEMDFNAGRYLESVSMDALTEDAFGLTLRVASGETSVGEKAGHSQVQIWREWRQTDGKRLANIQDRTRPSGHPVPLDSLPAYDATRTPNGDSQYSESDDEALRFQVFQSERGLACDQVGLIVPTSLCAGQIARLIAEQLNRGEVRSLGVSRFVALPHTEGCGNSGGDSEELYQRTMVGHLCHPFVRRGLLLEHGCERTHNDSMRNFMRALDVDPARYGWASVQLDGGIGAVSAKVARWFHESLQAAPIAAATEAGLDRLRLGLIVGDNLPAWAKTACLRLSRRIIRGGGAVVMPTSSPLLTPPDSTRQSTTDNLAAFGPTPTLAYGEAFAVNGLHLMETPTDHSVEIMTGLAATGVEVMLACVAERPLQSHPLIPLIQVNTDAAPDAASTDDFDLRLGMFDESATAGAEAMLKLVLQVASRAYTPKLFASGNIDFQVTRGWLGVSM